LSEAYEALAIRKKRAAYDQFGHAAFDPRQRANRGGGGFHDPFDIFREVFAAPPAAASLKIFSAAASKAIRPRRSAATTCAYDLEITLEEAASAAKRKISVTKLDRCETCSGSGAEAGSN